MAPKTVHKAVGHKKALFQYQGLTLLISYSIRTETSLEELIKT